jgi:hypothetical protein
MEWYQKESPPPTNSKYICQLTRSLEVCCYSKGVIHIDLFHMVLEELAWNDVHEGIQKKRPGNCQRPSSSCMTMFVLIQQHWEKMG